MAACGAERGNVQLFHPRVGGLTVAGHERFDQAFLSHFALVADDGSACGRAAQALSQVVIEDVEDDAGFAPHLEVARASGFRAVQSTPLVSTAGLLVGMVSTHFDRPHRPARDELELLASYGRSFGAELAALVHEAGESFDVLVADDDEAVRSSLALVLRSAGYRVAEASDGLDALAHLAQCDVGVMLLDVKMPGLDGLGLLDRLERPPPTIVLSANDHHAAVEALGPKVHAHFTKPVAPPTLLRRVGEILGGASLRPAQAVAGDRSSDA